MIVADPACTTTVPFPHLCRCPVAVLGTVPLRAWRLTGIFNLRTDRQLDQSFGQRRVLMSGADSFAAQRSKQRLKDKVVDQSRLMEAHLMLGRVDVDIHLTGIQLDIEHISGETIGRQQLIIGLTNGVVDELVAHHPAVDIGVLQVVLRSCPLRGCQPAPQTHVAMLALHRQRMVHEGGSADGGKAALLLRHGIGGFVLAHHLAVVAQDQGGIEAG